MIFRNFNLIVEMIKNCDDLDSIFRSQNADGININGSIDRLNVDFAEMMKIFDHFDMHWMGIYWLGLLKNRLQLESNEFQSYKFDLVRLGKEHDYEQLDKLWNNLMEISRTKLKTDEKFDGLNEQLKKDIDDVLSVGLKLNIIDDKKGLRENSDVKEFDKEEILSQGVEGLICMLVDLESMLLNDSLSSNREEMLSLYNDIVQKVASYKRFLDYYEVAIGELDKSYQKISQLKTQLKDLSSPQEVSQVRDLLNDAIEDNLKLKKQIVENISKIEFVGLQQLTIELQKKVNEIMKAQKELIRQVEVLTIQIKELMNKIAEIEQMLENINQEIRRLEEQKSKTDNNELQDSLKIQIESLKVDKQKIVEQLKVLKEEYAWLILQLKQVLNEFEENKLKNIGELENEECLDQEMTLTKRDDED